MRKMLADRRGLGGRVGLINLLVVMSLAACGQSPTVMQPVVVGMSPQEMQRQLDGMTNTAAAAATSQAAATWNAAATDDVARREATAIVMLAQANGTAQALAAQPTLTMAAATSTAGRETQTARETATAYPLTATPAAAEGALAVAQSESAMRWEERMNTFWNVVGLMCVAVLLAATIVTVAVIAKSNGFAADVAADLRLLLTLLVEHRRGQNALALVKLVAGSKDLYTIPGVNGIEVRSLSEGYNGWGGPVVIDVEALDREWRLAVWRLCEAEAAVGTFAGEALEAAGVIANDDDNWKMLTDVMAKAGMLVKRDRTRTKYAPGWSLDRVRAEREMLRLPHPNRLPPRVQFALEGQMRAD